MGTKECSATEIALGRTFRPFREHFGMMLLDESLYLGNLMILERPLCHHLRQTFSAKYFGMSGDLDVATVLVYDATSDFRLDLIHVRLAQRAV